MRDDPTLTLFAFCFFLILGLMSVGAWVLHNRHAVATLFREARARRSGDRWLEGQIASSKRVAAASFPGGSYVEEGGR